MMMLPTIVLLLAATSVLANCPDRKLQTVTLDQERFLGEWKTLYRFNSFLEQDYTCEVDKYEKGSDGKVHIHSRAYNTTEGKYHHLQGTVTFPEADQFQITYDQPNSPWNAKYWVLGTDYVNYLVIHSCLQTPDGLRALSWISSREKTLSKSVIPELKSILTANGLQGSYYEPISQDSCS